MKERAMKPMTVASVVIFGAVSVSLLPRVTLAQNNGDQGAMLLQMWDANSDGSVTLAEVQTRRGDMFTAFDANGDDVLTPDEMALLEEMRALQQEEMGSGMGAGHGKGKGHGKGNGQGKVMGGMGQTITRADFVAKGEAWLTRKDTNGDGVLTAADFAG